MKQEIIHRDIKPANILISEGVPKLADFGFAITKQNLKIQGETTSGFKVGTPLYMAPETLFHNQYSYKSDLWALGCVYYEMLFGVAPFQSFMHKELSEKMVQYQKDGILPFPINQQNVSQESLSLLKQMLKYDPNRRIDLTQITRLPIINADLKFKERQVKRQRSSLSNTSPVNVAQKLVQNDDQSILIDSTVMLKANLYFVDQPIEKKRTESPIRLKKRMSSGSLQSSPKKPLNVKISPEKSSFYHDLNKNQSPQNRAGYLSYIKFRDQNNTAIGGSNSFINYNKNIYSNNDKSSPTIQIGDTDSTISYQSSQSKPKITQINTLVNLTYCNSPVKCSPLILRNIKSNCFGSKITRQGIQIHSRTFQYDRDGTSFCQFINLTMDYLDDDPFFQDLEVCIKRKSEEEFEDMNQLCYLYRKLQYFGIKMQIMILNKFGVVESILEKQQQKFAALELPQDMFEDELFKLIHNEDYSLKLRFFTAYIEYLKMCILCFKKYLILKLDDHEGQLPQNMNKSIIRIDHVIIIYECVRLFISNFDDFSAFCQQSEIKRSLALKPTDNITFKNWLEIKNKIQILKLV